MRQKASSDRLARPVAVDLQVNWPQVVEAWPGRIPDLYAGQPLVQAVSFGDTARDGDDCLTQDDDHKKAKALVHMRLLLRDVADGEVGDWAIADFDE